MTAAITVMTLVIMAATLWPPEVVRSAVHSGSRDAQMDGSPGYFIGGDLPGGGRDRGHGHPGRGSGEGELRAVSRSEIACCRTAGRS